MVEVTKGLLSTPRDILQLIPDTRVKARVEAELIRQGVQQFSPKGAVSRTAAVQYTITSRYLCLTIFEQVYYQCYFALSVISDQHTTTSNALCEKKPTSLERKSTS